MDNEDDFTFCQVALPSNQNSSEAETKNLAAGIRGITIDDKLPNNTDSHQDSGVQWKDKLPNNSNMKEGTVGSLTFNVIDASSQKDPSHSLRQFASKDAGTSAKGEEPTNYSARKPITRTKVPFEKGYSQMDWLKLTRTHPDLAGLNGQSNKRLISMNEVKQHKTEGSMWTVLKGRVYNISPYMKFHPGGVDLLMKAVGKDCTGLFNKYHAWVNFEFLLEKCLVGTLDDREGSDKKPATSS